MGSLKRRNCEYKGLQELDTIRSPVPRTEAEWVLPDFRTNDKVFADREQEPAMAVSERPKAEPC